MPQFDPSSFISQIFWLAICFGTLYFSVSKIFLPRIKGVVEERKKNIKRNSLIAAELQHTIDKVNVAALQMRNGSALQYQLTMEQSAKQASLNREQALNDLRKKTDIIIDKSEQEINEFIQNSKNNCDSIVKNLVNVLSKKIFENNLSPEELSSLINSNQQ